MDLENFINSYPAEVRTLFNQARIVLLDRFKTLREEPDLPSRIIVYRIAPGNNGVVFTLIPSKSGVKLGLYRGRELPDPAGLLGGSGKVHTTTPLSEYLLTDPDFLNLLDAAMQNALHRVSQR